ncbi:MAG: DUF2860 family protein [Aquificaceae bacterium]|uniref:DUF2860 family protein n=1 Tax=Hydrogenobacter sp. Uz 6-8 TaxID=3384828 RepID=UPI000F1ADB53|nr:MAG: DUF2860 domain-containing protein [Aquificota bacterium]
MRAYRTLLTLLLPAASMAENRIGAGGALIWGEDNNSTRSTGIIKNLGKPEDSFLRAIPLIDLNLSYRSGANTYFLRTTTEGATPTLQAGLKREGFVFQSTEFYFGYNPFRRVWKDPYLVNIPREKTYQRDYEAGIRFSQGNSSLTLKSTYSDVEDDQLGKRERDLRRDRILIDTGYSYTYSFGKSLRLTPSVNLRYSEAKGRANSYAGYALGLSGSYRTGFYLFNAGMGVEVDRYMKQDPVLLKKRKETGYYALVALTRNNIFHQRIYITSLVA